MTRIRVVLFVFVIAVIVASLIECFLVLPGHLRGALAHTADTPSRGRQWFRRSFDGFRDGPFRRAVTVCIDWRYATVACAIAALILCVGLIMGGRIGFLFFPTPEADRALCLKFGRQVTRRILAGEYPKETPGAAPREAPRAFRFTPTENGATPPYHKESDS